LEKKITTTGDLDNLKKGEVIELPPFDEGTPLVARLRRPSLLTLCKNGTIPNTLLATAQKIYEGEKHGDIKNFSEVLHAVVKSALVEPKYEEVADILTDEQLTAIFNYTQTGILGLLPFRELRKKIEEFKKNRNSGKGKQSKGI